MSSTRAKSLLASLPSEMSVSFSINTYKQDLIEANAEERFGLSYGDADLRAEMRKIGLVNNEGEITTDGWDQLVKDSLKLEENSMSWLRKTFKSARADGHDNRDDLVGEVWFDPRDKNQVEEIYMGLNERVDMTDSSYGSLSNTVWKGISDFGQDILGGGINFEKYGEGGGPAFKDQIEEILDAHREASPPKRKKR